MVAAIAHLPIFKQRLPGLCAAWGPLGNPRPDTHFGHGDAWLDGLVCEDSSQVPIRGVVKLSVLGQSSSSSSTSIQEVRGGASDPSVSVAVHGTPGELRAGRQGAGIPCQEGCWERGRRRAPHTLG